MHPSRIFSAGKLRSNAPSCCRSHASCLHLRPTYINYYLSLIPCNRFNAESRRRHPDEGWHPLSNGRSINGHVRFDQCVVLCTNLNHRAPSRRSQDFICRTVQKEKVRHAGTLLTNESSRLQAGVQRIVNPARRELHAGESGRAFWVASDSIWAVCNACGWAHMWSMTRHNTMDEPPIRPATRGHGSLSRG